MQRHVILGQFDGSAATGKPEPWYGGAGAVAYVLDQGSPFEVAAAEQGIFPCRGAPHAEAVGVRTAIESVVRIAGQVDQIDPQLKPAIHIQGDNAGVIGFMQGKNRT